MLKPLFISEEIQTPRADIIKHLGPQSLYEREIKKNETRKVETFCPQGLQSDHIRQ